jgi:hypothetical protein
MTQLTDLDLWGNQISDVTPLSGMTQLMYLYLPYNQISDVAPLSGMTQLRILYLMYNNLDVSAGSVAMTVIHALQNQGTQGYYLPQNAARPANDSFASATIISGLSATVTGTNAGASKETGEPNHAGKPGGKSVWWSWTALSSGSAQIDTVGSNFDTTLGVYTGNSVSTLTLIAGNDDNSGNFTSKVTFNAVGGTTYRIAVDGYGGCSGNITLNVRLVPSNSAPTDIGLSSTSIAENQPIGTTIGTLSAVDPDADDTFRFSLPAGQADNASFTIDGAQLKSNAVFDYKTRNTYSVLVQTTDAGGLFFEKVFVINVTPIVLTASGPPVPISPTMAMVDSLTAWSSTPALSPSTEASASTV